MVAVSRYSDYKVPSNRSRSEIVQPEVAVIHLVELAHIPDDL